MRAGLFGAANSVMMNFVSWNRAYCLCPRMTFVGRTMCSLEHHPDATHEGAMARYERRGWGYLVDWKEEAELQSARRVGDWMTWVIPIGSSASADSEVESIRFRVGGEVRPVVLLEGW